MFSILFFPVSLFGWDLSSAYAKGEIASERETQQALHQRLEIDLSKSPERFGHSKTVRFSDGKTARQHRLKGKVCEFPRKNRCARETHTGTMV